MTTTPEELAKLIRPALTKLYVLYFRIAEQSDLTGPQMTIMTRLQDEGASRISHIAQAEGIRMPTASNALHQLEQRGMIERIRDESDRRGVKVQLTELGESELNRVGEERTAYLTEMLQTLPEDILADAEKLPAVINSLAESYSASLIEAAEEK